MRSRRHRTKEILAQSNFPKSHDCASETTNNIQNILGTHALKFDLERFSARNRLNKYFKKHGYQDREVFENNYNNPVVFKRRSLSGADIDDSLSPVKSSNDVNSTGNFHTHNYNDVMHYSNASSSSTNLQILDGIDGLIPSNKRKYKAWTFFSVFNTVFHIFSYYKNSEHIQLRKFHWQFLI